MALESEVWEKINGCLVRLYRELDAEKQPHLMLEVLDELVPTDSSGLNLFTLPSHLEVITRPEQFASEDQVATIGKFGHQSPFAAFYFATQNSSWMMPSDFIPMEDFRKLDLYQQGYTPLKIHFHMSAMLAMIGSTAHLLTIHRSEKEFNEREREILNAIQPHLVNSYINAIVHSRAQNSIAQLQAAVEVAPGAYGYFDRHGKVVWLQDKAAAWLNEFFPDEVKHNAKIPHSIQGLLQRSTENELAPQKLEKNTGKEILTACIGASPVGGWVMRLERRPAEFRPHFRPMPQLTERLNEVLRWMVEGKRNSEIGIILNISERTVEQHVSKILNQLQVENRATAILKAMEFCAFNGP